MALSNSDRQARYRQRLKDAALGDVLVVMNVNRDSPHRFNFPMRLHLLPAVGDQIITEFQGEVLDLRVIERRFLNPESPAERAMVLDCEGSFVSREAH